MSYPPGTRVKRCLFCELPLASQDEWESWDEDEKYKRVVFHVWIHHNERDKGRSLKETLSSGPLGEEE